MGILFHFLSTLNSVNGDRSSCRIGTDAIPLWLLPAERDFVNMQGSSITQNSYFIGVSSHLGSASSVGSVHKIQSPNHLTTIAHHHSRCSVHCNVKCGSSLDGFTMDSKEMVPVACLWSPIAYLGNGRCQSGQGAFSRSWQDTKPRCGPCPFTSFLPLHVVRELLFFGYPNILIIGSSPSNSRAAVPCLLQPVSSWLPPQATFYTIWRIWQFAKCPWVLLNKSNIDWP